MSLEGLVKVDYTSVQSVFTLLIVEGEQFDGWWT